MIDRLALNCAQWIKENDPDGPVSYDVILFALRVVINLFFAVVPCLIIGYSVGKFSDTLLAIYSFVSLRFFSGGFHFKSLDLCAVVTVILLSAVPFLAELNMNATFLNIFSLLLVAILAPTNLKNTRWTDKAKPIFKVISIIIVASNFYVNSSVMAVSFTIQSILLIIKRR